MAHFVWLDKPWTTNAEGLAANFPEKSKPWIVVASAFWFNEWRAFVRTTFLKDEFNPDVLRPLAAPLHAYVSTVRAVHCLDSPRGRALACGANRSRADERWPAGYDVAAVRASGVRLLGEAAWRNKLPGR